MTSTQYQTLLWIYVALMVAAVSAMFFPNYSEALSVAYENEPATWLMSNLWIAGGLLGALLILSLVGLVGLFRFKSWARPLSLYSTLASLFVYPFFGSSLSSGLESTLFEASNMVWGAILAMSYFSAISARFGR